VKSAASGASTLKIRLVHVRIQESRWVTLTIPQPHFLWAVFNLHIPGFRWLELS